MWECGLKRYETGYEHCETKVTPYVGVWIETANWFIHWRHLVSLLMWECGLKQEGRHHNGPGGRHSLCGSVD